MGDSVRKVDEDASGCSSGSTETVETGWGAGCRAVLMGDSDRKVDEDARMCSSDSTETIGTSVLAERRVAELVGARL